MAKTKEQQADTLANYLPSGRAFGAKRIPGSVIRRLLKGLAGELIRADEKTFQFRKFILPDSQTLFLEEWESALGIPDECFEAMGTDAERIRDIQAKLFGMNVQTEADFEALAARFGITVDVIPGAVHGNFPFTFPIIFFPDAKTARFTLIVNVTGQPNVFPYTFPIVFSSPELLLVQCLFNLVKPANCDILFTEF